MAGTVYKLTYFNVRARAEPARLIFAYAKVPYEDIRLDRDKWPDMKHTMPWDQVPILEVDGKILAQSMAIARYLGRKFNLVGENEFEAAKCDEYVDAVADTRVEWKRWMKEPVDSPQKDKMRQVLLQTHFPPYLKKFEKIASDGQKAGRKFIVSNSVTWADFVIAHMLEFYEDTVDKNLLADYPSLRLHRENVYGIPQIADWIAKRPKTPR